MTPVEKIKIEANIKKVYFFGASWMFMLILPFLIPFWKGLDFSMEEIFKLQSIFSLALLLFEIPSGYISDLLGRKKTLVVAAIIHGISFSIFPFCTTFMEFVLVEIFMAVGTALFSGTDIALLYDSMEAVGQKKDQASAIGKRMFSTQIGETLASIAGAGLALISLQMPFYINGIVCWVPLFFALSLHEPPRKLMDKKKHGENFKYIWTSLFKESKLLNFIILNFVIYSVCTLLAVWSFQIYWKELGVNLAWFGILWAATNLTVAFVGKNAHSFEKKYGTVTSLLAIGILPIIGFVGMGLIKTLYGILFCFCFQLCRGLGQVILKDALNYRVSADMRATANSVASMGVRVIFVAAGPLLGYLIDKKGLEVSFVSFGLFYVACFFVVLAPLISLRKEFR